MGIRSIMAAKAYQPRTHQEFWCSNCDCNIVNSAHVSSGLFFVCSGHSYRVGRERGLLMTPGEYDGIYTGVMFALCNHCLDTPDIEVGK
jgi:hypothetical protein